MPYTNSLNRTPPPENAQKSRLHRRSLFSGLGLLVLVLAGCSPTGTDQESVPVSDTALHAVMSRSLTEDLARLNSLTFDLQRTETELTLERRRRADEVIRSARRLEDSARRIRIRAEDLLVLTDSQQTLFGSLADELAESAANLAESAGRNPPDDLEHHMPRIRSTCDNCHSLYR